MSENPQLDRMINNEKIERHGWIQETLKPCPAKDVWAGLEVQEEPIPVLPRKKWQPRAETLEEKLQTSQDIDPNSVHELKVLCGLRENNLASSFEILEDAITEMEYQIRNMTEAKDKMKFELEYLRRVKVAENYRI